MITQAGRREGVKHYFNICNTALVTHQDSLVYAIAIARIDKIAGRENITLKVVDEKDSVLGQYTTYFKDGQLAPVRSGEVDPDARLAVRRGFLEQEVDHADPYIEHPEKLEWRWLAGG